MQEKRRRPLLRLRRAGIALALAAIAGAPSRAEAPEPPPYYAITNVTVVPGRGPAAEGMTVLLADGLIEAVGSDLSVPADAWKIDGSGMMLFPGLIDSLTNLAQPQAEGGAGRRAGGGPPDAGPTIRGPEDRPKTTPWVAAADGLADDGRIEKWRKAGFTATVTSPEDGLFAGQAALIDLGGGPEMRDWVLAAPVAQRLNFRATGGFRSYPGSLMGSLSYIQQVFLDTRYYILVKAAYAENPLGRERPAYDRVLESLEWSLDAGTPFLMPAHLGREIDRALALAAEEELPAVIYGGQGAYARVEALAQAGTPVLVSLNWPEEEKDRDPEAETSLRTLVHRRLAPTTPAALAAAGVPFALYSDGLGTPGEIFKKLRTALEGGLSDEDALTALTRSPAAIYGVGDRLGTIEAGKIANLVLASDWPWAEGVEVAAVFVDGRRYAERKEEEPSEPPGSDVSGTWSLTMTTPRGTQDLTAELTMDEKGKVTGEVTGERVTAIEEGRMSGDMLRFKTTRSMGPRSMTASWSLTVEGEDLTGSLSAGPMSMQISGKRTAKKEADGEEKTAEKKDEKPEVSMEELHEALAAFQGPVRRMGSFAITNATVWTVSGETIPSGTVVVRDGKIAAVGPEVKVPDGLEVIDAGGGHLIPGIFDAHSHIAIEGGVNEGTLAVTAMVGVEDVVNPDDINIYQALAGGVTTANLLHGSANPIGGKNQIIKLRWGADAEGLKLQGAMPGIKFALGENPKRSNFRRAGLPDRYPQTRMGVMDVIREAFTEAREYQKEWRAYEEAVAAREGAGKGRRKKGAPEPPMPIPPRRDLELEALAEILEGKRLVHSHCYRADEILQLLRLAEEFGFRVQTLQHVLEGYKVADEIAAHGAGASTFSDWWGYKVEAYDAIPYNAALMTQRGVVVSINSDSGEEMRHLNQEAGKAVKWGGLSDLEALRMVTLNPAKQFRLDDRLGSIDVGKDADLVLYDGPPLAIRSVVQKTFVDGDLYFDLGADRERQAQIEAVKAKLEPKKDDDGKKKEEEEPAAGEGSKPPPEVIWQEKNLGCREELR